MKAIFSCAVFAILIVSLVACAGKGGGDKARVKCPACGYEFDAPVE